MSFKVGSANRKDRIAGRFISQVHAVLARSAIEAKQETGRTMADVANELGIHRSVISRILAGGGNPTVRTIGELAGVLGYRPELVLHKVQTSVGANRPLATVSIVPDTAAPTTAAERNHGTVIYASKSRPASAGN